MRPTHDILCLIRLTRVREIREDLRVYIALLLQFLNRFRILMSTITGGRDGKINYGCELL